MNVDPTSDRTIVDRLHRRARAVITGFSPDVPAYPQTAPAMVEDDFVAGVRHNVDLIIRTIATGTQPSAAELEPIVELAVQRNVDGVPVSDVVEAYQSGAETIWRALTESATPAEQAVLLAAVPAMTRHLMTVTARIVGACGGPDAARTGDERRRVVAEAILAGHEPDPTASVVVAASYRVVVVSSAGGVDLRAVELALHALSDALVLAHPIGVVALVPADVDDQAEVLGALRDSSSTPRPPYAGISEPAPTAAAPAAFEQARLLCRLSTLLDRPIATMEDVLFPYLVATQQDSHPRLRAIAEAVSSQPTLAPTFDCFERCASNQLATARELGVHRNTVTYRLGRIAAVTGHDPTTIDGARVIAAALLVRALDGSAAVPADATR